MPFKIKNAKLALLALLFITLFTRLGIWQLHRAEQKKILLQHFADRQLSPPLHVNDLTNSELINKPLQMKNQDMRFFRLRLKGRFDNEHNLLLDNKIFHGQVGYEVYTPFKVIGAPLLLLVDRGFIPLGRSRQILPAIKKIPGEVTLSGLLNVPPAYVSLGQLLDVKKISWPLRIEFMDMTPLAKLLHTPLFPYVLIIDPAHPAAFAVEWQAVSMGPERHLAYAVQWFALALTLLILSVTLNCERLRN